MFDLEKKVFLLFFNCHNNILAFMETVHYIIDGQPCAVSIAGAPPFQFGRDEILSSETTDVTYHQDWYSEGYTEVPFLNEAEYESLHKGLTASIAAIVQKELGISTEGFTLEKYHHFVTRNEDHFKVVGKTRDLFADDFHFPVLELIPRLEKILGFKLNDIDPYLGHKVHIIVRINRPKSTDFNPPHKDIYEGVDIDNYIPQFLNFWIPVAGVTEKSSLPLAPRSHRIKESEILRTFDGGVVANNKYRVRMIQSWAGDTSLTRSGVKYGEVLLFSSHLIHGLATNDEEDTTRVALEFRLFKCD